MNQENVTFPSSFFKHDGVFTTAFWQMMSFIMLILLIWVDEVMDLSNLWFGISFDTPHFYRAFVLTIIVLGIAIITIGHTYLNQKRMIKRLIMICSRCKKLRVNEDEWQHFEQYVADLSQSTVSHGLCPQCFKISEKEITDYFIKTTPEEK